MRKLVIVLVTSAILMACKEQATDLHTQMKQLQEQVQHNQNVLTVVDITVQAHERHLKQLDRKVDDAALGIPDLRTR